MNHADWLGEIVGSSAAIRAAREAIEAFAKSNLPVLIIGETGTGKELVARAIHQLSGRAGAFVAIDATTLAEELAPAQLFGVAAGAGVTPSDGAIVAADGGTLLLDELDATPHRVQAMLLRFVATGEVRAVGSTLEHHVDVRVVAAANDASAIRADLRHRVAAAVIRMPPLRERREDIPVLARHILARLGRVETIPDDALAELQLHSFPGNVRELRAVLQRAILVAGAERLRAEHFRQFELDIEPSTPSVASLQREVETLRDQLRVLQTYTLRADPIWEGRAFSTDDRYSFVLMPFSDEHDLQRVYEDHVKPTLERCGLRAERADDIHDISGVMQSVWEGINRARVIVAEMTGRNPNVFYELGIAHTLGKPVIMITQSMDYVPFDLKHLRCIVYQYKPSLIQRFEASMEKTIRRVLGLTSRE